MNTDIAHVVQVEVQHFQDQSVDVLFNYGSIDVDEYIESFGVARYCNVSPSSYRRIMRLMNDMVERKQASGVTYFYHPFWPRVVRHHVFTL